MQIPWEAIATTLAFLVPAGAGFAFRMGKMEAANDENKEAIAKLKEEVKEQSPTAAINKLFSEITKLRESVARLEGILTTHGQSPKGGPHER